MNHEHGQGDDPEIPGKVRPASDANDQEAADDAQAVEPADGVGEGTTERIRPEARVAGADGGPGVQAANASDANRAPANKNSRRPWQKWGTKLWAGGVAAVVTGAVSAWLAGWFSFLAGPPATVSPSTAPIGHPGHLPGRQDVSTVAPGQRFYAAPNFYDFQSCGRPCWLPLYQRPTEKSPFVTDGWPCEYYEPDSTSSGSFCLKPPPGRGPNEMADPAIRNSCDRILVICQVTIIGKGQAAETIRNEIGQSSDIWDMVALPGSHISSDSVVAGRLSQIPGMPGFYEAFGPDIWLGNTGWHSIPCK